MSSNLLKSFFANVQSDDKRIIDTNELMAKRIEGLTAKLQEPENEGFAPGLNAPVVELLTSDDEAEPEMTLEEAQDNARIIIEKAKEEAQRILNDAITEAEKTKAEAQREAEDEREAISNRAKETGYSEGIARANEEAEVIKNNLNKREKELEEKYQRLIDELEPQFIDTITSIYEHIFHVELKSYREILIYLISTTMRKIEGGRDYIIHVSKEDYPFVSMQKKQIAAGCATANSSVEVVEDLTLAKNACLIETEGGVFDCGLGTQLSELSDRLKILSYSRDN